MIKKTDCYVVVCDKCEQSLTDNSDYNEGHYLSEEDAQDAALSCGWETDEKTGKWICEDCLCEPPDNTPNLTPAMV